MAEDTGGQEEVTSDWPRSVEWRLFAEIVCRQAVSRGDGAGGGWFHILLRPDGGPNRTISYIGDQKPCTLCTTTVRFRNADLVVSSFEKHDSEYDVVPLLLIFVLLHL